MLLSVRKQEIIREIEKSVVRGDIVDGYYSSAEFKFGKNEFKVVADVYEEGTRVGSAIYKNGELYRGSVVSNGRYINLSLYRDASLMEHQLLAICLIPGATAELLSEETNNVINHKVISYASLEARQAHYADLRYWSDCYINGRLDEYNKDKFYNKAYQPPCDVRELEVCTSAENYAHGAFIKTFGLYDISISAKDVPLLKQFMIDDNQVKYAMDLYMNHGTEVMLEMLRG